MTKIILAFFTFFSTIYKFISEKAGRKVIENGAEALQAAPERDELKEEITELHKLSLKHDREVLMALKPDLSDEEASEMLSEDFNDETLH